MASEAEAALKNAVFLVETLDFGHRGPEAIQRMQIHVPISPAERFQNLRRTALLSRPAAGTAQESRPTRF